MGAIRDKSDLHAVLRVFGDKLCQNIGEDFWAFLDGVEPRWPEEQGGLIIRAQAHFLLEKALVD